MVSRCPTRCSPWWTSYPWRLQVQQYDVAHLLSAETTVDVRLAPGWYRGALGFMDAQLDYGDSLAFLAALVVTYRDGTEQVVTTGTDWAGRRTDSPAASIYDGQSIDARRRGTETEVRAVREAAIDRSSLVDQVGPRIRRQQDVRPVAITRSPSGKVLVDFGQNLVGWVRSTSRHRPAPRSCSATPRCSRTGSSVPDRSGPRRRPTRSPVRGRPTCSSRPPPSTASRYVEVSGLAGRGDRRRRHGRRRALRHGADRHLRVLRPPGRAPRRQFGVVAARQLRRRAHGLPAARRADGLDRRHRRLRSHRRLPVRLRRPAAQVAPRPRDGDPAQRPGCVPLVVPDLMAMFTPDYAAIFESWKGPKAVWGDAAVWVPEALWHAYGDRDRLAAHYPAMALHLASIEPRLSDTGLWDADVQLGDWLDPDARPARAGKTLGRPRGGRHGPPAPVGPLRRHRGADPRPRRRRRPVDALADRTRPRFVQYDVDDDGIVRSGLRRRRTPSPSASPRSSTTSRDVGPAARSPPWWPPTSTACRPGSPARPT